MRLPREIVDTVRERTDLVELVQERIQLRRSGKEYIGLCPFHEEKTASLSVSPEKNLFQCFGCGEHGSAFDWTMKTEGVSWIESVQILAKRIGLDLGVESDNLRTRAAATDRKTMDSFSADELHSVSLRLGVFHGKMTSERQEKIHEQNRLRWRNWDYRP